MNNNNIVEHLIEDVNKKNKEVTSTNVKLKRYKVYSLITTILLIIVLITLFVKVDTIKLVVVFIFLIMFSIIYFVLKD